MPLYVNRVGLIQGRNGELKVLNSLTKQADMWSPSVMFTVQITDIQSGNKRNFQRVKRNDREGMSTFESNPNLSPIIILEIHPEKKRQNNEAARFISTFCRSSINLSYISRRRGTI